MPESRRPIETQYGDRSEMPYIHQTTNPRYQILGAHRSPRPQRASVGVPGSVVFGLGRLLPGVGPLSSDPPRTPGRDDALHLPGGPGPGRRNYGACVCAWWWWWWGGAPSHGPPAPQWPPHPRSPVIILPPPSTHSSSPRDPPRPPSPSSRMLPLVPMGWAATS